ncbi:metalloregulator ArsR/SmtB family transcription factor [Pimelobacter simplex]|uniref:Helix-turn-helix transcriptional regulator n=1 Tax=Nocardioides simplex TaxID=2045 RepID=A0A7J5E3Z4_NOCSI|nr:helix-turn-helix transcriptional regulator [Pimelobacter simplex]MCG8150839.1 metalloregulator ArsR/SmtB family transcription factor [Pimelobacter simplex]SFM83193.1 transcriptional regulator, ArsR family [Pimelobacter simplex]
MHICACKYASRTPRSRRADYDAPVGHAEDRSEPRPLDAAAAKSLAATLQALATPSRLLILDRLRRGPATVSELVEAIGMEQPAVSQQLRVLRNLGLVTGNREGRSIVYELYDDHVSALLDQAIYHGEHLRLGLPVSSRPAPA